MQLIPVYYKGEVVYTIVDDEDFQKLNQFKWYLNKGYAKRNQAAPLDGILVPMHRELLGSPEDFIVHHKDGNKLNNQKSNLEVKTHRDHSQYHNPGKSKYLGLTWVKAENKWQVQVCKQGKIHYCGRYKDEVEAAKVYDRRALELFGLEAQLNFTESRELTVPNTDQALAAFLKRPFGQLRPEDMGSTEG
jgi:hypothetical protein